MTSHQFTLTSYKLEIAFFAMVILFPFISYSQQTPVKRVDIVVSVTEKPGTVITQLPANDLPTAVSAKGKTKIYAKRESAPSTFSSPKKIKPNLSVVAKVKPKPLPATSKDQSKIEKSVKPKQELVKPQQETSLNQTALSKLKPASQQKETLKTAIPKPIQKEEKLIVESDNSKTDVVGNADVVHSNAQISETDKQNMVTYVWIGVILIVAGIVLGMLFGRTAFLISFIGVIFILLGVFIF